MQSWEIKALELEGSLLKSLDGFIDKHALLFFVGAVYLLLALLGWALSGGLRRKGGKRPSCIWPTIIIHLPETPPPTPPEPPFDPFPPLRECDCDHDRDDWMD